MMNPQSDPTIRLPKISIVTPSYNQGKFIEQTIQSVLEQNYPNLEYIIIDGGSSDDSVEIIRKYRKHLKYWVSEQDEGQSDAINKGLKHCKGEIFNWLNSDDYYENNVLHSVADAFMKSGADIVSGRENFIYEDGSTEIKNGTIIYKKLVNTIHEGVIYQPSTFWKLQIFNSLAPISPELNFLMDSELWIRYLLRYGQGKVVKIDDILANFRIHSKSKTTLQQGEFERERWSLKKTLMKAAKGPDILIDLLGNLCKNHNYNRSWDIDNLISKEDIHRRCGEDLLYEFYKKSDYCLSKQILRHLINQHGIWNGRNLNFIVKLEILPRFVLDFLRNSSQKM